MFYKSLVNINCSPSIHFSNIMSRLIFGEAKCRTELVFIESKTRKKALHFIWLKCWLKKSTIIELHNMIPYDFREYFKGKDKLQINSLKMSTTYKNNIKIKWSQWMHRCLPSKCYEYTLITPKSYKAVGFKLTLVEFTSTQINSYST